MAVEDHFLVPEEQRRDNLAADAALHMDRYLEVAEDLTAKAQMLNVLPESDAEGMQVKRALLMEAAAFRRAAKQSAKQTWQEHDRSSNPDDL